MSRRLLALLATALVLGCSAPKPASSPSPGPSGQAVSRVARAIVAKAAEIEPALTEHLQRLAREHGARLYKLEYRLKTQSSLERKLNKELASGPKRSAGEVTINDALRYTVLIDDAPSGRYVETLRSILGSLQDEGHRLIKLKNYWPRGDNYSGINTVLGHPADLQWELQFHTTASADANQRTRDWYEELRAMTTPVERKRELFKLMAEVWEGVEVPAGALEQTPIYPGAKVIQLPAP